MRRVAMMMGFGLMVLMAVAVSALSARYLLPTPVFPAPPMIPHLERWPWAVILHVAGGVTALALGPFQLVTRKGARRGWHRFSGRVYVLACLVGAAAGLWLAATTTAGPVAAAGFGSLAVMWTVTTAMGWRLAVRGDLSRHRRWMIRSLSLTLAAVTLRLLLPAAALGGLPFAVAYPAIAFLCWLPNLLLAELWLRMRAETVSRRTPRNA